MATVKVKTKELNNFQDSINKTHIKLVESVESKDELIIKAINALENAVEKARRLERQADEMHYEAQRMLREAEARTEYHNASLGEEEERIETPQVYFDQVESSARTLDSCIAKRQYLELKLEDFKDYSNQFKKEQSELLGEYHNYLKKSEDFFNTYTTLVIQAKEVIGKRNVVALIPHYEFTARDQSGLNENDIEIINKETGWSKNQIVLKCRKIKGGYFYRTTCFNYNNKRHESGVYYTTEAFTIGKIKFKGVFPRFNVLFEPKKMSSSLLKQSSTINEHFKYCNSELKKAVRSDKKLASLFSDYQLTQINNNITPAGYTWHHSHKVGQMQLVRRQEHDRTMKGAPHTGGRALWCPWCK